jgi:hypothetical protein
MTDSRRRHHDMGGLPAGKCVHDEHDYEAWEKRVDALLMVLARADRNLVRVDELRRHIEDLGPQAYDRMGYYERWMHSIARTLVERGVLSEEEIARVMSGKGADDYA